MRPDDFHLAELFPALGQGCQHGSVRMTYADTLSLFFRSRNKEFHLLADPLRFLNCIQKNMPTG